MSGTVSVDALAALNGQYINCSSDTYPTWALVVLLVARVTAQISREMN